MEENYDIELGFIKPSNEDNLFTIYSKSGCINCHNVKDFLNSNNIKYNVIDCDEYLLETKEEFLNFIELQAGKSYKTFPMVFYNKQFIGGFKDTTDYVNNIYNKSNLDFSSLNNF